MKKKSRFFSPLNTSIFSNEKNSEFLPKCCKMAVFALPPDPPREVPPSAVALSVPDKNPTFSQNLNGSTDLSLEEWHDSCILKTLNLII